MSRDFTVKVHRYSKGDNYIFSDGWFFSKVYAIDRTLDMFLVYDDGNTSSYSTDESFCPSGFMWVNFTEIMRDMDDNPIGLVVELVEV